MSHLIETLGRLVKAERAAGRGETFVLTYTGPVDREIIGHPGWHQGCDAPTNVEVDELADHGWVRITDSRGKPDTSPSRLPAATHGTVTFGESLPRPGAV